MNCRHCDSALSEPFVDLGFAPPSNAYLTAADLAKPEKYFPLKVMVCTSCWLVQTEDYAAAEELFDGQYAYFSSTSKTWLAHAAAYTSAMIERLRLSAESFVIEIAANDGYLLKNFVAAGVPCLGIEPTASTAAAAEAIGVPIRRAFFGEALGRELAAADRQADLIAGNNVYAHVPDINDFTRGLAAALKPDGVITLEFPHLMNLLENTQFDTIYHEHFSYLSLHTVSRIFSTAGLSVFDVEELPTHGGSLRIYGAHRDSARAQTPAVAALLTAEQNAGLQKLQTYRQFQTQADKVKNDLVAFLIEQKRAGRIVAGYGAAAKGNTLINYAGVKPDLLPFVCDAAPSKQGKFLPGSHIPILAPAAVAEKRPDLVLILPWNIAEEVKADIAPLLPAHTKFATAVPELRLA
jgi:SAM-dependent methyltransferase